MVKCNTCDDGLIRPPYWRNGNLGFQRYPWGSWQPVIPSLYWEAISPEQAVHDLYCYVENLLSYTNKQTEWIGENKTQLDELKTLFEKWQAHGFDEYYAEQVKQWLNEHMEFIFTHVANMIFPGITEDGYYFISIPDSWREIDFAVPVTPGEDYGRIFLEYVAEDAAHVF